eukprot:gene45-12859_t
MPPHTALLLHPYPGTLWLVELRNTVDPSTWPSGLSGWTAGSYPCGVPQWSRVTCSLADLPIGVDFSYLVMDGSLPSEWGYLDSLTSISFGSSNMSGTLPASWSGLTAIVQLDLSGNHFSGTLPTEWGSMGDLQQLNLASSDSPRSVTTIDLSYSSLSGVPLPPSLEFVLTLKSLVLNNNGFTGGLPVSYSALNALTKLQLQTNSLTGHLAHLMGPCPEPVATSQPGQQPAI